MSPERTVAVVLAGGVGTRVGLGTPKQLVRIAGKAIVEHTLERLEAHAGIDEIVIMMNAESIGEVDHLRRDPRFRKLSAVLPGGETRNDTSRLALEHLRGHEDVKVLFHDAVRPFVDPRTIDACIAALDEFDAVDTAIPSADTIIEVDDRDRIVGIPPRSRLRRGQTPQGFRRSVITRAYEVAKVDPDFAATDDCGVVFTYLPDVSIKVVEGTAANLKITEPLDLHVADKVFQMQSSTARSGSSALADLTGRSIVVFGASSGIGAAITRLATGAGANVHAFSRSETGTDVTRREDVRAALSAASAHGPIEDIIVTAGRLSVSDLVSLQDDDVRDLLGTNLMAPAIIAQESYPHLARSRGQLLLFTSSSYTRGRAGYALYSATKAGVVNLTQALADEWVEDGIRVNCINPQRTDTPMRRAAFGAEPAHTLLRAEDVAEVALGILDSTVTGQVLDVAVAPRRKDDQSLRSESRSTTTS